MGTEEDSSHIVSPAVADDNDILESYLSARPLPQGCSGIRSRRQLGVGQVRFNTVSRRPLGVVPNQSFAASKCELVEKYLDPEVGEYINL